MSRPPVAPLAAGAVLRLAGEIYRERASELFKAAAVVVAPLLTVELLARLLAGAADGAGAGPAALASITASFLAPTIATAACLVIGAGAYRDERIGWEASVDFVARLLGALLVVDLLIVLGAALGLLLLIVPGIYLAVAWSSAVPVLIFEGSRGRAALRRSRELVRGQWWPTFGVVLVAGLAGLTATLVSSAVGELILGGASGTAAEVVRTVATIGASVVALPFAAMASLVLFVQLRARHGELAVPEVPQGR